MSAVTKFYKRMAALHTAQTYAAQASCVISERLKILQMCKKKKKRASFTKSKRSFNLSKTEQETEAA